MKLIKCHVASFGKLKNFDYVFTDGINTIKEENGWGKTTLASFIKAMFFGMSGTKKSIDESDRKKYKPWNSIEKFGGSIDFIHSSGEQFRIERFFGNKDSEDSVKLINLSTGKESLKTENLGERLFGVSESGFFASTYFSQKDLEGVDNASLIEKLNSTYSKENKVSAVKAIEDLTEKSKDYKLLKGDKGKITDEKIKIVEIEKEIERAKKANETLIVVKSEIENLKSKAEKLQSEKSVLEDRYKKAQDYASIKLKHDRLVECGNNCEALRKKLADYKKTLNGQNPSDEEFKVCQECYNDLIKTRETINALINTVNELKTSEQKLTSKKESITPIIVFGALLAAAIITIIVLYNTAVLPLKITLFVLFGVLFLIEGWFVVKKIFRKLPTKTSNVSELISKKEAEIAEYEKIKKQYKEKIDEFMGRFSLPADNGFWDNISFVKNAAERYNEEFAELQNCEKNYVIYSQDKDAFIEVARPEEEDADSLNAKISRLSTEFYDCKDLIANKKSSLKALEEVADSLNVLQESLEEAKDNLKMFSNEYEIIKKTIEYITIADDKMKSKYREPLLEGFKKYLTNLSGKDFSNADLDLNLCASIGEESGQKEVAYYSKGYRNLFEICKRLSVIDILFEKERPFLMLDDPFCNLDKDKIGRSIELMKKIAEKYQIIYFVCHDSRVA